jgi:hypothetical protein
MCSHVLYLGSISSLVSSTDTWGVVLQQADSSMEPHQDILLEPDFVQVLRTEWTSVCSKFRRRITALHTISTAMTFAHIFCAFLSSPSINSMMNEPQPSATIHWLLKLMTNIDDFSAWHHGAVALKHHIVAFRDDITSSVSLEAARILILNSEFEFRSWQISADIILEQLCCQCQATMDVYQATRAAYLSMRTAMIHSAKC